MNWRSIAVWTLVVVGSFLTLTSILNAWASRQILSTSGWTNTSDKILADPNVRNAAAEALVTQLGKQVNLEQIIEKRFPRAAAVAPVVQGQLSGVLQSAAADALATPQAAKAWNAANTLAHSRAVAVLRGHKLANGAVATENGQIVLDLSPILQTLGGRLGVSAQAAQNPDAGKIVLFSQKGLKNAQFAVSVVDTLNQWLIFVAVAFFAGAVWLARPLKRRGVVIGIGSILFGLGLVLLVVRRVAIHAFMPSLAKTDNGKAAAVDIANIATTILHDLSLFILLIGLATLVWGWLGGESSPARWVRRAVAPFAQKRPWAIHLIVVGLLLLLLLWGPTGTVRRASGALVLLAIILVGVEALRRQSVHEFADTGGVAVSLPSRKKEPSMDDRLASLERLGALHDKGVLTDEEFAASKEQVLVGAGVGAGGAVTAVKASPPPPEEPPSDQA